MSQARADLLAAACELALLEGAARAVRPYRGAVRRLVEAAGVGTVQGKQVTFTAEERRVIDVWLRNQGIDSAVGAAPAGLGRTETAAFQHDEKAGSAPTGRYHQLVGIAAAGDADPCIAGVPLGRRLSGYQVIKADRSHDVRADWILAIENYETFVLLCEDPTPIARPGAGLLVFRSAPHLPAGLKWALAAAAHSNVPLWLAPDVDPSGLSAALGAGITGGAWLPALDSLDDFDVRHRLFDGQAAAAATLIERCRTQFPALLPWVEFVTARRTGISQEAAFAAGTSFTWVARG